MSEIISQVIEKSEEITSSPIIQKGVSVYSIFTGGAYTIGMIQDMLGLISVLVGIFAGIMVIVINYRKGRGVKLDNESKELINRKINLEIKALEDKINDNSNK